MTDKETIIADICARLKITALNNMQLEALIAMEEKDELILLSATGSGKTLAFLVPLILSLDKHVKTIQSLIIVPSRELALQITDVLKKIQPGFKITACYGGHKREIEENNLVEPPAIIVATPGRICDHIRRKNVDLSATGFLVLDEFDKSLELGFLEEMEFIIRSLPAVKKRMLTSATYSVEIPAFLDAANATTLNYLHIQDGKPSTVSFHTIHAPDTDKLETLLRLVCHLKNTSTIIFCNHRDAVERTSRFLCAYRWI